MEGIHTDDENYTLENGLWDNDGSFLASVDLNGAEGDKSQSFVRNLRGEKNRARVIDLEEGKIQIRWITSRNEGLENKPFGSEDLLGEKWKARSKRIYEPDSFEWVNTMYKDMKEMVYNYTNFTSFNKIRETWETFDKGYDSDGMWWTPAKVVLLM